MSSAETAMMVKEYIGDHYGPVRFAIGTNGSGAALQQYNIANNAPALLRGAMPTATFADILSTAMTVADCGLLEHYYETSNLNWSIAKKSEVDGHSILVDNLIDAIRKSWFHEFMPLRDTMKG